MDADLFSCLFFLICLLPSPSWELEDLFEALRCYECLPGAARFAFFSWGTFASLRVVGAVAEPQLLYRNP